MDHDLKINRSYAFIGNIEGDCPWIMCHSTRLTQSNPPTSKKKNISVVICHCNEKEGRNIQEINF